MQTGSSGCQFSWLTIFLLVAVVLGYQQQHFVLNAASVVGIATTTTRAKATKSNVSENVAVTAHKSTTMPTKTKSAVKRQLLHMKQTMADATATTTTTTKATTSATTDVDNGDIADKTTKTAAVDTFVALAATHIAHQQCNDATKEATTTTETPTITATSSSVSVRGSVAFRTTPKAAASATKTTTITNYCNTTNIPTGANGNSHNSHIATGTPTNQFQLATANSSSSRHRVTPPTTCGTSVSSIKPKIDCNNMINTTATKSGKIKCDHFGNSGKNNYNYHGGCPLLRTIGSTHAKSDATSVSYTKNSNSISHSNNNNNTESYNNNSHLTTCHHDCYDVR